MYFYAVMHVVTKANETKKEETAWLLFCSQHLFHVCVIFRFLQMVLF